MEASDLLLRQTIIQLEAWLAERAGPVEDETTFVPKGNGRDALCWHSGYLAALKDVLKIAGQPKPTQFH